MEEGAGREGKLQGETPGAATCNPRSRGRPAASAVEAASHEPCGGPAGPAGPAAAAGALAPHGRARLAQRGSSSAAAPAAAAGVLFLRPTGPGERPVAPPSREARVFTSAGSDLLLIFRPSIRPREVWFSSWLYSTPILLRHSLFSRIRDEVALSTFARFFRIFATGEKKFRTIRAPKLGAEAGRRLLEVQRTLSRRAQLIVSPCTSTATKCTFRFWTQT